MIDSGLPADAVRGRRTPDFTTATVPPGLLAAHKTSVWAQLVVTAGSVVFVDEVTGAATTVGVPAPHTITPDRKHHVEPADDAEFHVQFYDLSS